MINPGGAIYSWVPGGKLAVRSEGNPEYIASIDPRIKAIVCCSPWGQGLMGGNALQTWTSSALANIKIPSMFIVGERGRTTPATSWFGDKGSDNFYQGVFSKDGETCTGRWQWPQRQRPDRRLRSCCDSRQITRPPYVLETSERTRPAMADTHPKATAPASATITPAQLMKTLVTTMRSGRATTDAIQ